MLGVSLATVVNWVKNGLLEAHRTPGGHRRISPESLVCFSRSQSYPLPPEIVSLAARRTVVVVDAERDFGEMVSEYLEMKGEFEVHVADGAFAAGLLVGDRHPHVVLMDLAMSDLDVNDALKQIRSLRPSAKVIATTAFRTAELERTIEAAGFDGSLDKPLQLDALLELMRKWAQ